MVKNQGQDNSNDSQYSTHVEINHSSHQETRTEKPRAEGAPTPSASSVSDDDLKSRIDELTADLQRIQADFVNFRRRSDDERGEFLALAKQDIIIQLLPLLDNIGRAMDHIPDDLADNAWAQGVAQVAKQADETFKSLGITRIETVGQPFDPNLHEAIGYEEGEGEHEVVVEELQAGYKAGDRVIRHAIVKVGKK